MKVDLAQRSATPAAAASAFIAGVMCLGACLDTGGNLPPPTPEPTGPTFVCGDGFCSYPFETRASCPTDCPPRSFCGDGLCAVGETCANCPGDCGACASSCEASDLGISETIRLDDELPADPSEIEDASCGDGAAAAVRRYAWTAAATGRYEIAWSASFASVLDVRSGHCAGPELACVVTEASAAGVTETDLEAGERIVIAVAGLGGASGDFSLSVTRAPAACGNRLCEAGETCASCPADCGPCMAPPVCGDDLCAPAESCATCEADCGPCPPTPLCGDAVCDSTESCGNCPSDCGLCLPPPPSCGDGVCDIGETCTLCPGDCGFCPPPTPFCGDGFCDVGEDCVSCPFDCD